MIKKIKKFNIIIIFLFIILFTSLSSALICQASTASDIYSQMNNSGQKAWGGNAPGATGMTTIVKTVIQAFLGLLGIIFLVLIIYAGYNWMTAQGEEEKVTKAKDTLTRAIIGLIIITAAYSITYFVFSSLPGGDGETGAAQTGPIN